VWGYCSHHHEPDEEDLGADKCRERGSIRQRQTRHFVGTLLRRLQETNPQYPGSSAKGWRDIDLADWL
jgi:hypothetical protein